MQRSHDKHRRASMLVGPASRRITTSSLVSAARASIAMPAKRCCAATDDGVHHLAVLRGEMRSMPLDEAAVGYTEDVGHLGVSEQHLDGAQIGTRFKQVRRVAVPERVRRTRLVIPAAFAASVTAIQATFVVTGTSAR